MATSSGSRRDDTGDGARPFHVVGVYEPTPDPLRITGLRLEARLHLPDLIDLMADPADPLSAESVTTINVALVDPADAADFAQDLDARVAGAEDAPDDAATPPVGPVRGDRAVSSRDLDRHPHRQYDVPARPDGDAGRGAS